MEKTMNTTEHSDRKVQTLPEAQAKSTASEAKNKPNDDALPGFGMWADREDMSDTATYIREVRSPRYKL